MSLTLAVLTGYLVDALIGDPPWLPHPVRGLGWLIARLEPPLRRLGRAPWAEALQGALLTLLVVSVAGLAGWGLVAATQPIHPALSAGLTAAGVGVLLARRSLAEEAGEAVLRALAAGDLPGARRALARVVGRDTAGLDVSEVARGAVETLAENLSDGVVAPLFYALLGGLPAMAAYKAINTLDSMIGHKDHRYRFFGQVAARLDDLANWLPARITFLALVAAAALKGGRARAAWRAAWADASRHESPNAGWPEAAMAGALGVRLGGLNYYDGEPHPGPLFNPRGRRPAADDIAAALGLVQLGAHLALAAGMAPGLLMAGLMK